MIVDPDLTAILLAFGAAALLTAAGSSRGIRERRRARRFCLQCGRRLIRNHPTCECDS